VYSAGCRRAAPATEPTPGDQTGTSDKSRGSSPSSTKKDGSAPKGPDGATGLRKEQLVGEWEGTLKDGTILALKFTDKLVVVSLLAPGTDRAKAREAVEWASGDLGRAAGSIGSTD